MDVSYTKASVLPVEGARVGLISCKKCGCALFLDPRDSLDDINVVLIHDEWHGLQEDGPTLPDWAKKLLARGMSNAAVAKQLGLSESSVRRLSQDSQRL